MRTNKHSNQTKKSIKKQIKIEISTYGTKLKPEIKLTLKEAIERSRFLLEMGYDIKLFQQNSKGDWLPFNYKINHAALPKL